MGYIISNRMVPMIVLKILWTDSEKDHPISLNQLGKELMEVFEPTVEYQGKSLGKKIVKIINELNHFFEQIDDYRVEGFSLRIIKVQMKNDKYTHSHCVGYYLEGRMFSDAEIHLLSDGVLYSPGIERRQAGILFEKLSKMSSKYFTNAFDYVKYSDVVNRTNNDEVFRNIEVIATGIKKSCRISFCYGNREQEVQVSPYYLVICIGNYYLLCNKSGRNDISHYRVDRIKNIELLCESSNPIDSLKELNESRFDVENYIKQHPRMSTGELVRVALLVMDEYMEAVRMEFFIEYICKINEQQHLVRIKATRTAICNWVINMTGKVLIKDDYGYGVKELLCQKAREIIEAYE